jgi:hypothetical protein
MKRILSQKKSIWRAATWISGSIWLLSWIGIYLEIFYWHHMTPSLRLNPPAQIPGMPSVIAPLFFLTLVLMLWMRRKLSKS